MNNSSECGNISRVFKKSGGIDCPARTIHEEDLQAAVVTVEFQSGLKIDVEA